MIQFACECGRRLGAREEKAGGRVRCPGCGAVVRVPEAADAAVQTAPPERSREDDRRRERDEDNRDRDRDSDQDRGRRRRDERDNAPQTTSGKAVVSLVMGMCSFFLCLLTGLPAVLLGFLALRDISKSEGRLSGKGMAIGGTITGALGTVATALLVFGYMVYKEARSNIDEVANLRRVGDAMHKYHDENDLFPLAATVTPEGKLGLSWRVQILPQLGETGLYRRFNLEEAWDSPHNKRLLTEMPKFYQTPGEPEDKDGNTRIQAIAGPGALFEKLTEPMQIKDRHKKFVSMASLRDGTINTVMFAVAANKVPWTKPADMEYDPEGPLPQLHLKNGKYRVVFADATVRQMQPTVPESVMRLLITRNDGQALPDGDW